MPSLRHSWAEVTTMLLLQLATVALLLVLFSRLAGIKKRLASIDGTLAELAVARAAEGVLARTAPTPAQDTPASQAGWSTEPWELGGPPRPRPAPEAARPSAPSAPKLAAPVPLPPPPAPPAPAVALASAPAPARPAVDLELRFGRRWAALLGGGVVAFGLALLVRHSIQQGWFPPSVRLVGAALLSLALCGTAELFRQRGMDCCWPRTLPGCRTSSCSSRWRRCWAFSCSCWVSASQPRRRGRAPWRRCLPPPPWAPLRR